jgi:hypothetical protein
VALWHTQLQPGPRLAVTAGFDPGGSRPISLSACNHDDPRLTV